MGSTVGADIARVGTELRHKSEKVFASANEISRRKLIPRAKESLHGQFTEQSFT